MNKTELVEAMAAKAGTSKKDTEAVLNAFIETVSDELQAKATTKIAACTAPKFKAGKALKDKVNTKAKKSKK